MFFLLSSCFTFEMASATITRPTATFALSVAAQGVALFDYFPDQFCISDPDPLPVISGDTNGVFSVLFGGALVDPQTGLIDLGGSVPGDSILIQYRVPGLSAACPDSTVRLIRIFAFCRTLARGCTRRS